MEDRQTTNNKAKFNIDTQNGPKNIKVNFNTFYLPPWGAFYNKKWLKYSHLKLMSKTPKTVHLTYQDGTYLQ